MLGETEREGVDSRAPGPRPRQAGGVVTGALRLHQPRGEVPDGVAADHGDVLGGLAHRGV